MKYLPGEVVQSKAGYYEALLGELEDEDTGLLWACIRKAKAHPPAEAIAGLTELEVLNLGKDHWSLVQALAGQYRIAKAACVFCVHAHQLAAAASRPATEACDNCLVPRYAPKGCRQTGNMWARAAVNPPAAVAEAGYILKLIYRAIHLVAHKEV